MFHTCFTSHVWCVNCWWNFGLVGGARLHNSTYIIPYSPLILTLHQPSIYSLNIFRTKIVEKCYCPHHLKHSNIWSNKPKQCLSSLNQCRYFQILNYVLRKSRSMQKPVKYQLNIKHMLLLINTRNTHDYG